MKKAMALAALLAALVCLVPGSVFAAEDLPVILTQPASLCYGVGETATYYVDASGSGLSYEWHLLDGAANDYVLPGQPGPWAGGLSGFGVSQDGKSLYLEGLTTQVDGLFLYCVVSGAAGSVRSNYATVMVSPNENLPPAPQIVVPGTVTCRVGEKVFLTAQVRTANVSEHAGPWLEYEWQKYPSPALVGGSECMASSDGILSATSFSCEVDTSVPGTYYYICKVTDGEDWPDRNVSYSGMVTVIVNAGETEEVTGIELLSPPAKKDYLVGQYVDLTGLKVRLLTTQGDRETDDYTKFIPSPVQITQPGEQKITVRYGKFSAEYTVTARQEQDPSEGVRILIQPVSTTVKAGTDAVFSCECSQADALYRWGMVAPDGTRYLEIDEILYPVTGSDTGILTVHQVPASLDGAVFFCAVMPKDAERIYSEQAILHVEGGSPEPAAPERREIGLRKLLIIAGCLLLAAAAVVIALLLRKRPAMSEQEKREADHQVKELLEKEEGPIQGPSDDDNIL